VLVSHPARPARPSKNGTTLAKKDEKSHKNAPLIGIDIGGTGIKGGIVDLKKGKLIGDRFRLATPQPATPAAVVEVVAQVVEELSARPDAPEADSPVGVTFPGIIQHGVVHSAANVDKTWINTDIDALLTARLGSTRPSIAEGFELEAITMVVLGGVSILGGAGSILGVVLAALIVGLVTFGLGLLNVPGIVMTIFTGTLLIVVIALPILFRMWRQRA